MVIVCIGKNWLKAVTKRIVSQYVTAIFNRLSRRTIGTVTVIVDATNGVAFAEVLGPKQRHG